MKKPLELNHDLVSMSLPEMPEDFRGQMEQMIDHLPESGKDKIMKKKISIGMVLAFVLALLTMGGVAAALLTPQEVVEKQAIPLALGNDGILVNDTFSPEELAAFISAVEENGITLDETSRVIAAIRNGEGYWEEEAIMEVCKAAFGRDPGEWTLEQQNWFNEVMVEIGFYSEAPGTAEPGDVAGTVFTMPGAENLSEDEVIAMAKAAIREKYGAELPLDDPDRYGIARDFYQVDGDASWTVRFNAKDLWSSTYTFYLLEGEDYTDVMETPGLPREGYSAAEAYMVMQRLSNIPQVWSQETWHEYGLILRGGIQPADGEYNAAVVRGLSASDYPLPDEADMTRTEAIEMAKADAEKNGEKQTSARDETAVLLDSAAGHVWKVGLGDRLYEIDAKTGTILSAEKPQRDDAYELRFMLRETYDRFFFVSGEVREEDVVRSVMEKVHEQQPKLGLDDKAQYELILSHYYKGKPDERIELVWRAKEVALPDVYAETDGRGNVKLLEIRDDGDNMMRHFLNVFGWRGEWTQDVWVKLGEQLAGMDVTTDQAKLLQASRFIPEAPGSISADEAIAIAAKHANDRTTEINGIVYIGSEPHDVWKIHLLKNSVPYIVNYEVDAVTGEVLNAEPRVVDYDQLDPAWKDFILKKTYARYLMDNGQMDKLARWAAIYKFGDLSYDECSTYLSDEGSFEVETDGLTVTFVPHDAAYPKYRVVLDEDGNAVEVERIGTPENEIVSAGNG